MSIRLKALSLGAGVQSSCLLLMAEYGEIERPDCAIFADTQAETLATYKHLDWLESVVTIPIHRVTRGNLEENVLRAVGSDMWRVAQPPLYVKNRSDDRSGMLWRECTQDYKMEMIEATVRQLLGYRKGQHIKGVQAQQWIGISMDEVGRMKPARVKWIENTFPLIDLGMSRRDCEKWFDDKVLPRPPRSACRFCPYHSNAYWRDLKMNHPEDWEKTVQFDNAIRRGKLKGVRGDAYVHRDMIPIEDVDLRSLEDQGQINMFMNECEGVCGV